jgi:hypothetical protein
VQSSSSGRVNHPLAPNSNVFEHRQKFAFENKNRSGHISGSTNINSNSTMQRLSKHKKTNPSTPIATPVANKVKARAVGATTR